MPILTDPRNNTFLGQLDVIGGETQVDGRAAVVNFAFANAECLLDLHGHATLVAAFQSTAFNGTVVFEGSIDGTNWFPLAGYNVVTGAFVASVVVTTTISAMFAISCAGYRRVRARCSARTSGDVDVALRATTSDFALIAERFPATNTLSATGAAGAIATLTIPAAPGLFHYIDSIKVQRFATALLTAGAAPVIVTTTNLAGGFTLNFPADAAAAGSQVTDGFQFGMPLRSAAANVATTIVCPATPLVIWKATAIWRLGA